ncbi:uncharacterized protein [Clytia hemisphaerica]|uniref:Uncharacterized protein n=1 Tax=Clytia hemisphaerica TaxID=252671 RepID=A0A7M5X389_9CNID
MGLKRKMTTVFTNKKNSKKDKKREATKREKALSQESLRIQSLQSYSETDSPSFSQEFIAAIESLVSEPFADSGVSCMDRKRSSSVAGQSTIRCNTRIMSRTDHNQTVARPMTARILSRPGEAIQHIETRMKSTLTAEQPLTPSSSEGSMDSNSGASVGSSSDESTSFFDRFVPKRSFSGVNQNQITKLYSISRGYLGEPNSGCEDQTLVMDFEEFEESLRPIIPKVRSPPPSDQNTMYKLMLTDPLRFRKLDGGKPVLPGITETKESVTSRLSDNGRPTTAASLQPSSSNESWVWPKRNTELTPYVKPTRVPEIKYGWKTGPESRHTVSEKLYLYRTINESKNIEKNGLQNAAAKTEESPTPSLLSVLGNTETVEEYLQNINEHACRWTEEDIINPKGEKRFRRKLVEGAYPNKTVAEDTLPRLLRYVWKGKYKKVLKYLKDKTKWQKANNQDKFGRTVLHYAASFADYKMLKILLDIEGINPNIKDCHDKTPLIRAIEMQSLSCVRLLVQAGARARITCRDGRNALAYALTEYGDKCFDIIEYLYNGRGIRDVDFERPHMTLLHQAMVTKKTVNNKKVIKMLLNNATVDINAVEGGGKTPLILAAMKNRVDLMKILLDNKADRCIFDKENKSAAHYLKNGSDGIKVLNKFRSK